MENEVSKKERKEQSDDKLVMEYVGKKYPIIKNILF